MLSTHIDSKRETMKEESPSSTAYTVIHGILHTARNPALRHLVDDEVIDACTMILSASEEGKKRLAQLDSPIRSRLLPFLEWLLLPGITLNYVLRKRFIEAKVNEAIDAGYTQVVNIGAGFDSLAWRLSRRFPSVNFIEIDHPATGKEKIKAFSSADSIPENLHFITADLSQKKLESVLDAGSGFDPGRKTIYIAEGVLMYLKEEHVTGLFKALKRLTGPGSRFVFSGMEPDESEKNNIRPLLHLYLRVKNERYNWYIRESGMPAFLAAQEYTQVEYADSESYRQDYLPPDYTGVLHRGEYVVLAEAD